MSPRTAVSITADAASPPAQLDLFGDTATTATSTA